MMRSPSVAIGATAGSCVNQPTTTPAKTTKDTPSAPRTATLNQHARHADAPARSGGPAPRFWPASVAAAFDNPQDGISTNMTIRITIVDAAIDTLPKDAITRMTPM